jgi:hypothetical protein
MEFYSLFIFCSYIFYSNIFRANVYWQSEVKMSQILIEQTDFATLWFHPEKKIVHHETHKFTHGEAFRAFLLKGTETMKKNGATKWLSDDRKNPVLKTEDMEWGQTNWFPQTLQAGWKYWAIVQPESAITKMNMDKLIKDYGQAGIIAKYFSDPDEAMKWLEEQP